MKKEVLVLLDIKINCMVRVIKIVWDCFKNKENNGGE